MSVNTLHHFDEDTINVLVCLLFLLEFGFWVSSLLARGYNNMYELVNTKNILSYTIYLIIHSAWFIKQESLAVLELFVHSF